MAGEWRSSTLPHPMLTLCGVLGIACDTSYYVGYARAHLPVAPPPPASLPPAVAKVPSVRYMHTAVAPGPSAASPSASNPSSLVRVRVRVRVRLRVRVRVRVKVRLRV